MADEITKPKKKRGHPETLVSFRDMPKERARELQSKGGKASQAKLREKRAFKDIMMAILDLPLNNGDVNYDFKSLKDMSGKNVDTKTAIAYAQIKQALKGNLNAFNMISQIIGELKVDDPQLNKLDDLLKEVKKQSEDK